MDGSMDRGMTRMAVWIEGWWCEQRDASMGRGMVVWTEGWECGQRDGGVDRGIRVWAEGWKCGQRMARWPSPSLYQQADTSSACWPLTTAAG